MDFVTFSVVIDDIVFPDGQTAMGVLGGGGPQTAFGLRLWADQVGLVGGVGDDLPAEARVWLQAFGIDTQGLHVSKKWPTPRAWQVLEADGRRTQVWRMPDPALGPQLARRLARLPENYRQAQGFHLGVHPEDPNLDFIRSLRALGAVVSVEPFRRSPRALSDMELRQLLSAGMIFSANLPEAESLVGPGKPAELIRRMATAGAAVIALRLGAGGTIVHRADMAETWHVRAVTTGVVDPTGAGNAFCGGFLAGWVLHRDLRTAGLCGVVAASFLVEQVGLPDFRPNLPREATARLQTLRPDVRKMSI